MNAQWIRNSVLGTLLLAGLAGAETTGAAAGVPAQTQDDSIRAGVLHEIRMYPRYSIFDNVRFRVENGTVSLSGEVNQPYKKSDLGNILAKLPGVVAVDNNLKVAPLSSFDDHIRIQVARAIYADPVLSRYGMGTQPSIHILVDNGHITLEGVVDNQMAKDVAGIRANSNLSFGQVTNNLQVVRPSPTKRG